ncbi:MAG TPA: NDP-sugar synthase [Blastocatellia bacterium]|nr:NDP-sugar synthase [Blastocatellia bacterium]
MHAIILAGGYAQRLSPLTKSIPKPLLHIAGRPVISFLLDKVTKVPSLSEIVMVTDNRFAEAFDTFAESVGGMYSTPLSVSYHKPDGDALKGPLAKVKELLAERDDYRGGDYLLIGGDNVFGSDLSSFCNFYYERQRVPCIAIHERPEAGDASDYGVPRWDPSGRVAAIVEKPSESSEEMVSTACYCLSYEDLYLVLEYLDAGRPDNLGSFVSYVANKKGAINPFKFREPWFDIGTRCGLLDANRFLISNVRHEVALGRSRVKPPVFLERGVTIEDSEIGPHVYIRRGTVISKSKILNSVVYENCRVESSHMAHTIVGPASKIKGDVVEATIGPGTEIAFEGHGRQLVPGVKQ